MKCNVNNVSPFIVNWMISYQVFQYLGKKTIIADYNIWKYKHYIVIIFLKRSRYGADMLINNLPEINLLLTQSTQILITCYCANA